VRCGHPGAARHRAERRRRVPATAAVRATARCVCPSGRGQFGIGVGEPGGLLSRGWGRHIGGNAG
jgi:hypothetical protein